MKKLSFWVDCRKYKSTQRSQSITFCDIPYLGEKFFKPKSIKYTPTELLIFLKPTIFKADQDDTAENIKTIDDRIQGEYAPKFRSPSGQVLGMPDIDGKKNSSFSKDTQSRKPNL